MLDEARELRWLRRIRDLSHRLANEDEVAALLPQILDAAIAEAERGFLVQVTGRKPAVVCRRSAESARGSRLQRRASRGPP